MSARVSPLREPWVDGGKTLARITEDVCAPLERGPAPSWYWGLGASLTALLIGKIVVVHQIWTGIGTWGLNKTVGWSWDITNFVFWVGIGHAGTLISAILFLFRQKWRTSINRAAEAMTIFAVMCAGLFPLIHMGRPWLAYWVFPYPNELGPLWVNFRSPLLWDVFAISTYFIISATFWYVGLWPDLATVRDRSQGLRKKIFGVLSLGWDGSHRSWSRYETMYLLLAGLATPLVFSVHTIVSFDFATSVIPGWHTTIFPPYFVCGAIFSGFAMVMTLMIIARKVMRFEEYITLRHIDAMCKITLLTSMIVALAYGTELFMAWYSGNPYEQFAFLNRIYGPYRAGYALMVFCNVLVPQALWFKAVRRNPLWVFPISILINVGMWLERFVIITVSLHRDYLPSSWTMYYPTYVEIGTFLGSFGLFFTCFFLFCRFLPMIACSEVKAISTFAQENRETPRG
ncbi:MAG: hydrogenase [Elusimicrobia bacterium CG1_02_63_36]|nr:MAG: hydrogenase [Elusimicrobia bacterium CG1_02_63_36]PIP83358.1 MAG: hydrogenase [Elusimicrobia bacterium CG22_combo_CG10-13_8_21_14_all_63_91]PJA14849.1 MAG: hydrogenase [Elusimicrobia bacterium CG_4_10_14_0_2_um_filter_63_34]PJB23095.1 MAG: hydrogenase [Elusimicrobia bacterium CG_4_9_14_3_um_filter_62_55]